MEDEEERQLVADEERKALEAVPAAVGGLSGMLGDAKPTPADDVCKVFDVGFAEEIEEVAHMGSTRTASIPSPFAASLRAPLKWFTIQSALKAVCAFTISPTPLMCIAVILGPSQPS